MKETNAQKSGEITVFLSLLFVLILSLLFASMESAAVYAARARAAGLTDTAGFSALAHYHKELMEEYDLFFLDAGYGADSLQMEQVEGLMRKYIKPTIEEEKQLNLISLKLTDIYAAGREMATDHQGAVFQKQAISYMKAAYGFELASNLLEKLTKEQNYEDAVKKYEEAQKENEQDMKDKEKEKQEWLEQKEEEHEDAGEGAVQTEPQEEVKNPLPVLAEIKKHGILMLAVKDTGKISQHSVDSDKLVSQRSLMQGNRDQSYKVSALEQVLFQEYLLEKFFYYGNIETKKDTAKSENSQNAGKSLEYQVEYILNGKSSDEENLRGVVRKLLLMREGCNYLHLAGDAKKKSEAYTLAAAITAIFPIPGLTKVTQIALMLGWAFGESVLDVRVLLAGGKVPFMKSSKDWNLELSQLAELLELWKSPQDQKDGLAYKDYLRILLFIQSSKNYAVRAMDMMELRIREKTGDQNFKMDHCLSWFRVNTSWEIPYRYSRFSFVAGTGTQSSLEYEIEAAFEYD